MKKLLLLAVAAVLGVGSLSANPVDVNTAKSLGQKFVQTNFNLSRGADLQLVYTYGTERGDASLYVFNVGDNGFVVLSADDRFRPIVGYSDESTFDVDNISPECNFYLKSIALGRGLAKESSPDPQVVDEWQSLSNSGRLLSYNGGKGTDYLVKTRWNQTPAPYNSMCPADPLASGIGGHDYVGCVATASSQLMKYWNYPTQGQGSHSYICYAQPQSGYAGHPEYGTLTANFGATTYQWDQMLNSYTTSNYTPEQGQAVATICYHCGVAVNMMYGNEQDQGSGAFTDDVPSAIQNYFLYSNAASLQSYNGNVTVWKNKLKEQFDMGWPVYYSGTDPTPYTGGGHAFICDGYNDADLFHFNWGWGGYQDGWFVVNEIDYYQSMRIITNFVPTPVYNNTAQAPTNVTATKANDIDQVATISWTNPSKTLNNQNISAIERIVVERNNVVIYTEDNVTPGANMTFVDSQVPCYSTFEYKVYAVIDGYNGKVGIASESFGPTCEWKVVATATAIQGWKGGQICAYDGAGREITSVTMTSNNPANLPINVTLGKVSFGWKPGTDVVTLSFKIKDASGNVVYDFPQNTSDSIPSGMFYVGNNGCGNSAPAEGPGELFATKDGDNVILTWGGAKTDYGYNIYRDGYLFELAHANEFVDEAPEHGGHCYYVCVLGEGGESEASNEACATAGDGCEEGHNLWFEIQANNKPIITWDAPNNPEGLAGYEVSRKKNEDGEYDVIKLLGPDKTQYKETKSLTDGNWYYYRVVAVYEDDCKSAPIKSRFDNEYFVKIYYSVTDVNDALAGKVVVYPNPVKDNFTVEAEGLQNVMVYNTVGQLVYSQACEGNAATINLGNVNAGFYMVKVVCTEGETVRKISVVR